MAPAIRTENLTKRYGQSEALVGLDLQVDEGEVYGYLGPNGAGKSTTIALLLGFIRASAGRAEIFGLDVRRDAERLHERVAYVPSARERGQAVPRRVFLLTGATLALVPASQISGAITLAFAPRRVPAVVYVVVGGSLIVDLVGSLVTSLGSLTRVSIFHYVALAPAEDPSWANVLASTAIAALLITLAIAAFDRRDLAAD